MNKKPVVLYGASGYTAGLIMECLRNYQIPFIAAGRNKARIEANVAAVVGSETAEYEIVEVKHTVEALTELFTGAKLVINTVGPYVWYQNEVMQAAANAKIHYTDCGGGQIDMMQARERFADQFEANGKVMASGVSYMCTFLELAARFVLDVPGINTLEAVCSPTLYPTPASAQTLMALLDCGEVTYYLEKGKLLNWKPATTTDVILPDAINARPGHAWGGSTLPIIFENDSRVQSVRAVTAPSNSDVLWGLVELQRLYEEEIKHLPEEEKRARLAEMGESMTAERPPRENPMLDHTVDMVTGRGTSNSASCVIRSSCCYQLTGVIQAAVANVLIQDDNKTAGFTTGAAAVGHAELFSMMKNTWVMDMEMKVN